MPETFWAQGRQQAGHHQHPTAGGLDSPSVQTTARGGERGDESGQKVQGRQRPLLVDTLGLLLAVRVTAASVSAPAGAQRLCAQFGGAGTKGRVSGGDGTYRGHLVEWGRQPLRFVLRVTWRLEGATGFGLLPRRWGVERTRAWLNQSRRVSADSARLPKSREAMIDLSITRLMLRRLAAA